MGHTGQASHGRDSDLDLSPSGRDRHLRVPGPSYQRRCPSPRTTGMLGHSTPHASPWRRVPTAKHRVAVRRGDTCGQFLWSDRSQPCPRMCVTPPAASPVLQGGGYTRGRRHAGTEGPCLCGPPACVLGHVRMSWDRSVSPTVSGGFSARRHPGSWGASAGSRARSRIPAVEPCWSSCSRNPPRPLQCLGAGWRRVRRAGRVQGGAHGTQGGRRGVYSTRPRGPLPSSS